MVGYQICLIVIFTGRQWIDYDTLSAGDLQNIQWSSQEN